MDLPLLKRLGFSKEEQGIIWAQWVDLDDKKQTAMLVSDDEVLRSALKHRFLKTTDMCLVDDVRVKRQKLEEPLEEKIEGQSPLGVFQYHQKLSLGVCFSMLTECNSLRNELKDQFYFENGQSTPDLLWDVSVVVTLPHASTCGTYSYMGRHVAQELFRKVTALRRKEELTIVGAKGSGKSTIAETLAYFLIASGEPAVYFSANSFIKNPVIVMLHGLLLAVEAEQSAVKKLTDWKDIVEWCTNFGKRICFFVDDWDTFENKQGKRDLFYEACFLHGVICIISTNSDLRIKKLQSDKDKEKLQIIDGPYTADELKTWVSQSSLKVTDDCDFWVHLDYWTGGMPGLLKFYEEAGGESEQFIQYIDRSHTQNLRSKIINLANTLEELLACLNFVTKGELLGSLSCAWGREVVDLTCFYQDKKFKWYVLCPFLKAKAEEMIVERLNNFHLEFSLDRLESWTKVVAADCSEEHVNRARVGWNVESLVLSVMKCRKHVFQDWLPYSRYEEYLPGEQDAILERLPESEFRKGVLLIPKKYYEKAIDCLYIHWADDKYMVVGIQISVGGWKAKQRKESHTQWNADIWVHEGAKHTTLETNYYYVMPKAENSGCAFQWRKFSDISHLLGFLDDITLKEPEKKETIKQCQGYTKKGRQCCRWGKDNLCNQHVVAGSFQSLQGLGEQHMTADSDCEPEKKETIKQCEGITKKGKQCCRWGKEKFCNQHKKEK